MKVSVSVSD